MSKQPPSNTDKLSVLETMMVYHYQQEATKMKDLAREWEQAYQYVDERCNTLYEQAVGYMRDLRNQERATQYADRQNRALFDLIVDMMVVMPPGNEAVFRHRLGSALVGDLENPLDVEVIDLTASDTEEESEDMLS